MATTNRKLRPLRGADQIAAVRALRAQGATLRQIARTIGRNCRTVTALLAEIGPPPDGPAGSEDREDHEVENRLATVQHLRDILREHGFDKRWDSYALKPETATPLDAWRALDFSPVGSPAQMCTASRGR